MNTDTATAALRWQLKAWEQLSLDELHDILALRQRVFVVEQTCPYLDIDGLDRAALHLSVLEQGLLLGYLRCLAPGVTWPSASLGRIVVSPDARGRDLGRELVRRGLQTCREQWPKAGVEIGAQAYLRKFYAEFGFEARGEEYIEDGIAHVHMVLSQP